MQLLLLNKPHGVLSQFSASDGQITLAGYVSTKGVYPAGRLDKDSEGLLLLTDDGRLQTEISHPRHKLEKRYWVQVEGQASEQHMDNLRRGVVLKDGPARATIARQIESPQLWPRDPPVRFRKTVPDSWIEVVITEGRNRQVRRMCAAAGLPALRLVRHQVGPWKLRSLQPGEYHSLSSGDARQMLKKR